MRSAHRTGLNAPTSVSTRTLRTLVHRRHTRECGVNGRSDDCPKERAAEDLAHCVIAEPNARPPNGGGGEDSEPADDPESRSEDDSEAGSDGGVNADLPDPGYRRGSDEAGEHRDGQGSNLSSRVQHVQER